MFKSEEYIDIEKRIVELKDEITDNIVEIPYLKMIKGFEVYAAYVHNIGIYEMRELKAQIKEAKAKYKLEYIQLCKKEKIPMDIKYMNASINKACAEDVERLAAMTSDVTMIKNAEECRNVDSDQELNKKNYKYIIKSIHPDVKENAEPEDFKVLAIATDYYEGEEDDKLQEVVDLMHTKKAYVEPTVDLEGLKKRYAKLYNRNQRFLKVINTLQTNFPLSKEELVSDKVEVKRIQKMLINSEKRLLENEKKMQEKIKENKNT
ncbi:MAG: hypothetical protein RR922_05695 [Clostridia bacterium]